MYCTFLQTHVYHARLAQLQEEVLVFLIFLIVNNFHVNYFAAGGTARGEAERTERREAETMGKEEEGAGGDKGGGGEGGREEEERLICDGRRQEVQL